MKSCTFVSDDDEAYKYKHLVGHPVADGNEACLKGMPVVVTTAGTVCRDDCPYCQLEFVGLLKDVI
ncbi:hypothetical protein [Methanohalobium sp.]|uniref:hypothetical protein n=1 Tax=Methanohalobium sp. TaxID=2837493 RepID=UPI0025E4BFCC|nr:hypothetical protein [Methanohalobium sp.]